MSLLCPDVGEVQLLKVALGKAAQEDQTLKLFTNDKTPAEGDVAGDYTEASGSGYAAKTLTGSSWSVANDAGVTTAEYAEQEFAFSGALGNVYGYFIIGATSGLILWAERFTGAPFNVAGATTPIRITPKITLE